MWNVDGLKSIGCLEDKYKQICILHTVGGINDLERGSGLLLNFNRGFRIRR